MTARRARKYDALLRPGATTQEIRAEYQTCQFDEVSRAMDLKWGMDRLPALVPQEVADKYAKALGAMNEAMRDANPEETFKHAQNCVRGMRKMDELAEAAGHPKADPDAYTECAADDGTIFAILHDERYWPAVKEKRPDLTICTKREVAIALDFKKHALVREVDKHFPNAEVTAIKPMGTEFYNGGGDELPW